jgi:hypothetical protein
MSDAAAIKTNSRFMDTPDFLALVARLHSQAGTCGRFKAAVWAPRIANVALRY